MSLDQLYRSYGGAPNTKNAKGGAVKNSLYVMDTGSSKPATMGMQGGVIGVG